MDGSVRGWWWGEVEAKGEITPTPSPPESLQGEGEPLFHVVGVV